MSREWSKEETFRLIRMYEEAAVLWDVKSRDHRNKDKRTIYLRKIAEEFSTTPEEVSRKMHNLRSQLSQELRKARSKESEENNEDTYNIRWPFYDALKFLIDINTPRPVRHAPKDGLTRQEPPAQDTEHSDENQADETGSVGGSEVSATSLSGSKRKDLSKLPQRKKLCGSTEAIAKKQPKVPDDDYSLFGQFIASEMRGFRSEDSRRRFKIGVQRLLLEVSEAEYYLEDQRQHSARRTK